MSAKLKTIIIGAGVFLISLIALYFIGRILNPPAQQVYVAVREIQIGEALAPDAVQLVSVRVPDVAPYVTVSDINTYGFTKVIETIHQGMFVPKAALSYEQNTASVNRVAASIADPNSVAIVVPVTPLTSPSDLVVGDRVSLIVSVGSATFLTGDMSAQPTAPVGGSSLDAVAANAGALILGGNNQSQNPFDLLNPTPTVSATPRITMPISKNLVVDARILRILYDMKLNPSFNTSQGGQTSEMTKGDIKAIVVSIPRTVEEALAYGINNGEVRVAVLDPLAKKENTNVSAGMSWDDMVAFYRWQRQLWLMTPPPLDSVNAPGASSLYATLMATNYPSATPTVTPIPSFTPTSQPTPNGWTIEMVQTATAMANSPLVPTETPAAKK